MKRKFLVPLIMVAVTSVVGVFCLSDIMKASTAPLSNATNIALATNGTTVSTSHVNDWAEGAGYGMATLIDGESNNTDYYYMSDANAEYQDTEMEVALTFDKVYQVDEVRLYALPQGGFPVDFTISAYTDNGWQTVVTKTDYQTQDTEWHTFQFEDVDCSAIRLNTTENGLFTGGTEYGIILGEFEVYGVESTIALPSNIALATNGTDVSTSHVNEWGEDVGLGMANLIDGQKETGAFGITAAETDLRNTEMYIQLDFDDTYRISSVSLYSVADGGFPVDFTISINTTNGWKTVVTREDYAVSATKHTFEFEAVDGTAVRLTATEHGEANGGVYGIYLDEFEVYGIPFSALTENIALASNGITAVTSHVNSDMADYSVDKLIDGRSDNTDYFFMSAADAGYQNTQMQVTLNFDKTYGINQIRLYEQHLGGFPKDFTLSAYTGDGWKVVASETDYQSLGQEGWHEFTFDVTECSAVRLSTTENGQFTGGSEYGVILGEFEVYGTEVTTVIPAPPVDDEQNPPAESTNIGLASNGTTVSTSHVNAEMSELGFGVDKLIDGLSANTDHFFMSAASPDYKDTEMQVTLKFDGTYQIDKIRLYELHLGGFPTDFTISAYTVDGWKILKSVTDYQAFGSEGWHEFVFDAVDCSAVRLSTTENGQFTGGAEYGLILGEFEVYGITADTVVPTPPAEDDAEKEETQPDTEKNVALSSNGTKAYSSHADEWGESVGFGIANVNDGAVGDTFFFTSGDANTENTQMRVSLNFKQAYKVNKIRLYAVADGGFPVDFTLSAYTASGWKTVVTERGYKATTGWQTFEFDAVDCSAVRLTSTKNGITSNHQYCIYLGEFEAYGVKATTAVPAAPIDKLDDVTGSATGSTPGSGAGNETGNASGFTYNADKNLALYVPATANSDYAIWGMGPDKMTDGDLYSFFSCDLLKSSKDVPEWVEVNLLKNYAIDTVVLYARNYGYGFPIDFTISVFYDGKWTEVVRKTGYSSPFAEGVTEHVFKFPATIGNQIRVEATNCQLADGEYGLQLNEVVVYGEAVSGDYVLPNSNIVTIGTEVTASTTLEDFNFYTEYLTDGNTATGYSSDQHMSPDNVEWIELDFKRSMSMGALRLKPAWGGNGFPVDFNVQVLVNDEWITALTVEDYEEPIDEAWQEFVFDKLYEASKLRITVTKLGEDFGQYCLKLNEIEVYPYATQNEDLGAVEVVNSKRSTYNSAEELTTKFDIPYVVLIAGLLLIVLAITSGIIAYIRVSKKTK